MEQDTSKPTYEIHAKFQTLKSAVLNQKQNVKECRRQFLEICRSYCVSLQVLTKPTTDDFAAEVLQIHKELIPVRDAITDWIILEGDTQNEDFSKALLQFMEVMLAITSRPKNINSWNDLWFLSHQIFAYETFLYILAALIKIEAFQQVYILLHSSYLLPDHLVSPGTEFANYSELFVNSDFLQPLQSWLN